MITPTLIEAAQDVIACANPLGTTSNVRVPKYVMAALEQAIAQEQCVRNCGTCSHNKVSSYLYEPCCQCMRKRGHKDNWEPKP
jgi:hypothetical protein